MAGAPANMKMHFRIGSMAIPHLITLLLQLQDEGRLSLEDPLSNWLPQVATSSALVPARELGVSIHSSSAPAGGFSVCRPPRSTPLPKGDA